eukprot:COSAG06_NODE_47652_length_337_cov_5.369748_1_plen_29_part_01
MRFFAQQEGSSRKDELDLCPQPKMTLTLT